MQKDYFASDFETGESSQPRDYFTEDFGSAPAAQGSQSPKPLSLMDNTVGRFGAWLNPTPWEERGFISKYLPPFSPLQMAFSPQAERFGEGMVEGARRIGRVPGNVAEALIGQAKPRVSPPGVYPRVQRPSEMEIGLRSAVPAALDAVIGGPLETGASLITPHSLGLLAATGPAFEIATASRLANLPLREIPKHLLPKPSVEQTITKAIRPSVAGKGTARLTKKYYQDAEEAVRTIVEYRPELRLPDETGQGIPRLPQSLKDFSDAIEQTKFTVFKQYDQMARSAGEAGATVPTKAAADAALETSKNRVLRQYYPEVANYAQQWALRLRQLRRHTPEEAQDLIAKLNADLETYYRNPHPGDAAKSVIDAGIANNLRRALDQTIEGAGGAQYQLLKRKYGALKAIERDVNRRAIIFARQNNKGLIDFSDIFSGAQMVHGVLTGSGSQMAAAATAKSIALWYRWLNNPDAMVRGMFERAAERFALPPSEGILSRAAARVAPALRGVAERLPKGERGSLGIEPRQVPVVVKFE